MAYKQNNPLSRQKWGGNKDDYHRHMDAEGHMTKSGVVGGGKYGKGGHYKDYEGPSRKGRAKDHGMTDDNPRWKEHFKMAGHHMRDDSGDKDSGMSRQPWGGNKHDYKRRDVDGVMKKTGDVDGHYKDYEGPSRISGNTITGIRRTLRDMENYASDDYGYEQSPSYTGSVHSWDPQHVIDSGREDIRLKTIHRDLRKGFGHDTEGHTMDIDRHTEALNEMEGLSRHGSMKGDQSATHTDYAHYEGTDEGYHGHTGASHGDQSATHRDYMVDPRRSPLSNASHYGIQGVNESDWIKYGGDVIDETAQKHEGMSRMSSPLNSDDKWIQKAFADVKARGTEGVCTGDKFGSSSCPPGSKRYNMAKTLRKINKK